MIDDIRDLLVEADNMEFDGYYFRHFEPVPFGESGLKISVQNSMFHYCHSRMSHDRVPPPSAEECRDFEIAFLWHKIDTVLHEVDYPDTLRVILKKLNLADRGDDVLGWVHWQIVTALYNKMEENIRQICMELGGAQLTPIDLPVEAPQEPLTPS